MKNPITWVTREIRTRIALKFIPKGKLHLDIGCGPEHYLLKRSPCVNKVGLDKQLGNFITDKIPLGDGTADCITMLAVIEHLDSPFEIIKECYRVLRPDGILIITTPKAKVLWITRIYAPGYEKIEGTHKQHFDEAGMRKLLAGYFSVMIARTFCFGFNQLFVCMKMA